MKSCDYPNLYRYHCNLRNHVLSSIPSKIDFISVKQKGIYSGANEIERWNGKYINFAYMIDCLLI